MRNYQPKKNNKYKLDPILFRRMIYLVKDYERMKKIMENVEYISSDGQVAGPSRCKNVELDRISEECRVIEWALAQIPAEYQKDVFKKVCHDSAYPLYADPSTYSRWKCRFLYHIAKELMYI